MAEKTKAQERHEEVIDKIGVVECKVDTMRTALIGTEDKVGYFERVRNLENWSLNQKKIYWIFATAIIVDIGSRFAEYIK